MGVKPPHLLLLSVLVACSTCGDTAPIAEFPKFASVVSVPMHAVSRSSTAWPSPSTTESASAATSPTGTTAATPNGDGLLSGAGSSASAGSAAASSPLCTLSTPGEWSQPHYQHWAPTTPCTWSIDSLDSFKRAFRGMTLTFVGDSVTRYAMRAIGKKLMGVPDLGLAYYDLWDLPLGPERGDITLRYRHDGQASGIIDFIAPTKKELNTFDTAVSPEATSLWVINAGLWQTAWPTGVMNFRWEEMAADGSITLASVLQRYREQLTQARDGILAAMPHVAASCAGRARIVFRLTTPVFDPVPARPGWLAWANTAFGDVNQAVEALNELAREVWAEAGLPVIHVRQFADAPAHVRPKLTVDNVHMPDDLSVDFMLYIFSTLYDAGLATEKPPGVGGGPGRGVLGWPACVPDL